MSHYSDSDINNLRKEEAKAERRATLKASRDKIIQGIADNGKRSGERAIWELIQNARDYSGSKPAVITIELFHDKLSFSHQGIPFTIRTLKDLILQQSTKHEGDDTVGQYGTGFMATHEFSRKVFISGDCQIGNTDVYVSLPEGFCLNRSMEEEAPFIDEMEAELSVVDEMFDMINQGHSVPCSDTVFTYPFEQEGKAEKVSTQITTTIKLMPFVLVFNDRIMKCSLINHLTGESITFSKSARIENPTYEASVKIVKNTITIVNQSGGVRSIDISSLESMDGNDRIIIPPLPIGFDDINSIPSQFIFFPLLGTEQFGTGFIFHSKRLYPTEKRESFLLPWDNDNMKTKYEHNETVLDELISMLFKFYDNRPAEQHLPVEFAKVAISRTEEEEPDTVRRAYLSKLQKKFADKLIHWKMIPTDKGFMSIQDDSEIVVLHRKVYEDLTKETTELYLPTIISYASENHTIPNKDIIEWSDVVYSWNPDISGYYITLEDICKAIKEKGNNLKSFLDLLTTIGRTDLLSEHKLIPNRDGVLHTSKYLKDAKDITSELFTLAKPLMGNDAEQLVDQSFADVVTLNEYTRKDLRDTIKLQIDDLRQQTHKWRRASYYAPTPRSLADVSSETTVSLDNILSFCSAFPVEKPQNFRSRLVEVICRLNDKSFSPSYIAPLADDEVDMYESAFNFLIDDTLLILSKKESNWLTDEEEGSANQTLLKEFLDVYTGSKDPDRLKKLNDFGVFPNQLFEMSLPSELQKSAGQAIPESILDLYGEVAVVVGEKTLTDYRSILVNESFRDFYAFSECKASTITGKIEAMLREKDEDYSWPDSKNIVLKIVEHIDNGDWPDPEVFREIKAKKLTIFFKNTVSGEKGKHVYTLLRQSDSILEDLAEMTSDPDFEDVISCAKAILQQKKDEESDFQFKKEIGNHIERLLRSKLNDSLNQNSDDFEFSVEDVQNGQDIVIRYKNSVIYYIEVKTKWNFTTSGPAYMSKNQVLKACNNPERYALCCVDLTDYGLSDRTYPENIERISSRINIHFEIGDKLKALMKPTLEADTTPEELISIDGDYKARIPAKVFRNGAPLDLLINKILEKSIQ